MATIEWVHGALPEPVAVRVTERRPDVDAEDVVATSHQRVVALADATLAWRRML